MRLTEPLAASMRALVLAGVLLVAGCADPLHINGLPRPTPDSSALNGCQTQQAPVNLPSADIFLTQRDGSGGPPSSSDTVTPIRVGQVVEVRLPATINWNLNEEPSSAVLQSFAPQSWYRAANQTCVWRFRATGAGSATLAYSGGLVCAPDEACPAIAAISRYSLVVSE